MSGLAGNLCGTTTATITDQEKRWLDDVRSGRARVTYNYGGGEHAQGACSICGFGNGGWGGTTPCESNFSGSHEAHAVYAADLKRRGCLKKR